MAPGDDDDPQDRQWVIEIEDRLNERLDSNAKSSCTIEAVPSNWRGVHNNAFVPEMVKIGPFRVDLETFRRVRVMEEHKMRFLRRLLGGKSERWGNGRDMSRTTEGETVSNDRERGGGMAKGVRLDDLLEAVQMLEQETKDCYPKRFISVKGFRMMMVVNGCFVVELLRLYYDFLHNKLPVEAIEDDPIFTNPRILATLRRDLLLLENQLPFFLLEKLYELINKKNKIDHQQAVPLEELAVTFFDPLLPQRNAAPAKPKAHLLDVFRSTFFKSVSEKVRKKGNNRVKPRLNPDGSIRGLVPHFASELEEAGVRFKKRKGHDLLDIESGHRTLWVPPLSTDDHTISLLLNFVAYELSVHHPEPFFTNYFMFWDSLVNSPRDVQILHKHGIINLLGSEKDVAELMMKCREVIYDLDLGYLYDEIKEVNDYCERHYESNCHVWWRSLIRERFSSPWTCIALFAATFLLLLTVLQTIYTVYPYYRPH